jgi:hypothetical protein
MGLLGAFGRALVIGRLLGLGRDRRHARGRQGRGGFFGPFPYYSRRTRGGSRVTVSGCCLPIPLGMLTLLALGARTLVRR